MCRGEMRSSLGVVKLSILCLRLSRGLDARGCRLLRRRSVMPWWRRGSYATTSSLDNDCALHLLGSFGFPRASGQCLESLVVFAFDASSSCPPICIPARTWDYHRPVQTRNRPSPLAQVVPIVTSLIQPTSADRSCCVRMTSHISTNWARAPQVRHASPFFKLKLSYFF